MTVVSRRIVSTPERSATETWLAITNLLAPKTGDGRRELEKIAGVACSLISSEAPANDAIVVWGNGPRLRIYCLFNSDASVADDANEMALVSCPTEGDWSMSLPCPEDDLNWLTKELASLSKRVTARRLGDFVSDEQTEVQSGMDEAVDAKAFFRS